MLSVLQSVFIVLGTVVLSLVFLSVLATRMARDAKDRTQRHYWLADQRAGNDVRGDSRVHALERLE